VNAHDQQYQDKKLSGISGTETGIVTTYICITLGTWTYAQINLKTVTNLEVTW
jgi:hypothetical protein